MDILASLMPTAAPAPVAESVAVDAPVVPGASFAAVLTQVTAVVSPELPAPLPVVTPQVQPEVAAPVMVAPEPVVPVVVQALPVDEPEVERPPVLPDEPVAEVEAAKPATKAESSLDDIRQRMALIETAGQLDASAVIVAPPIAVSLPVPVNVTPSASEPVINRATAQAPSLPAAADDEPDTPEPVDLPDAMPALVATVADAVPQVRPQADDRQPDNPDSPSVFSLAPAPASQVAAPVADNDVVVATAVGSTDWAADLGQQMVDMVTRGDRQVDLRLHPADLGPLSISLNLSDGTTQAQFQVAHASVRAAVEQALPQLREALATQGIALGQASVSDQSSRGSAQRDPQPTRLSRSDTSPVSEPVVVQQVQLARSAIDLYV